ncbi:MAG TPA: hypothetical protein VLZ84_00915 [Asticcacaulis sp.]|nr:hypothetical protein [Asticcacaulis sp.]
MNILRIFVIRLKADFGVKKQFRDSAVKRYHPYRDELMDYVGQ